MSWCKYCGMYHLYGACTVTSDSVEESWKRLRDLIQQLARLPR